MNIGFNLSQIMSAKNLSSKQLADLTDLPLDTIKSILYGKSTNPSIRVVKTICNALEISYETLVDDYNLMDSDMMSLYNRCSPSVQNTLKMIASNNIVRANNRAHHSTREIKVVIPTSLEADGIINDTCETELIETDHLTAFLGYKIMTNNFFDIDIYKGDVILLDHRDPRDGEMAVFSNGYYSYFRKLEEHDNYYLLKALSKSAKDITVTTKDKYYKWNCVGTYSGKISK